MVWIEFIYVREGEVAVCGEHGNEPFSSIKWGDLTSF